MRMALIAAVALAANAIALPLGRPGDPGPPRALVPGAGNTASTVDPLAWDSDRQAELEARAAAGLSHVLYAKSPGGAMASAARTARWRPLVDRTAEQTGVDADMLEAIVFLESAGRADAQASDDLNGAVGLTQILAETARNLLGMRVDVEASARLTQGSSRGRRVAQRERKRRRVDERFDPAKALAATGRYLRIAERAVHRDDLAIAAYHMGIGNLQGALRAYGEEDIPYAQLFFDSSPLRHAAAWRRLAVLGDDSSTYLWRVLASRDIMRLYRDDPEALARQELLQTRKPSAEDVLHPLDRTQIFADPTAVARARAAGELQPLTREGLRGFGLRIAPRMGELADRVRQSPRLYRALRPQALRTLEVIGAGVRAIAHTRPLIVTSTVRDARYERVLAEQGLADADPYSLHTTGWAFDVGRRYRSAAQAEAFQFMLDRLTALNMIAWVREADAIHVTVASAP
jgi:hypothetical protein